MDEACAVVGDRNVAVGRFAGADALHEVRLVRFVGEVALVLIYHPAVGFEHLPGAAVTSQEHQPVRAEDLYAAGTLGPVRPLRTIADLIRELAQLGLVGAALT